MLKKETKYVMITESNLDTRVVVKGEIGKVEEEREREREREN